MRHQRLDMLGLEQYYNQEPVLCVNTEGVDSATMATMMGSMLSLSENDNAFGIYNGRGFPAMARVIGYCEEATSLLEGTFIANIVFTGINGDCAETELGNISKSTTITTEDDMIASFCYNIDDFVEKESKSSFCLNYLTSYGSVFDYEKIRVTMSASLSYETEVDEETVTVTLPYVVYGCVWFAPLPVGME